MANELMNGIRFKISQKNPAYATLLALNACNYDLEASVERVDSEQNDYTIDGFKYSNDASLARFVVRTCASHANELLGANISEQLQVDEWVTAVEEMLEYDGCGDVEEFMKLVVTRLNRSSTLALDRITLADFVVWALLARNQQLLQKQQSLKKFFERILNDERFAEAHQIAGKFSVITPVVTVNGKEKQQQKKTKTNERKTAEQNAGQTKEKTKDEGKFAELPGAEKGKVVVRFPPEASGYLHIGHAKAALLNQYYQQTFEGQLIMRFDDTNPAKENAHFEEVIKEDLAMLEVKPDRWTHTSDHFETILGMCERLLKEGKAFVDDTDAETMRKEREERKESRNRNNPVAKNLELWDEMKRGTQRGQQCCVRIKIDMSSNNGAMRDPTIYRCKNEAHVRTGNKFKVYPTYDFACPIVDSLEGVTHSLRTTEYVDRDEQFYFICDVLGLRKPYIWSYARLNMTNTVMSKRKLTWLVDEHHVESWNDPRLPTVRGIMRRGLTVEGLKQFIVAQGGSRSIVTMEWDKIWSFNKKVIDPVAPRFTALSTEDELVKIKVNGQSKAESKSVSVHPKRTDIGEKEIWYAGTVYVERIDANEMKIGDTVTFINWGNMKIVDVRKDKNGKIEGISADLDLDNKNYKNTLKVTWIGESSEQGEPRIPVVEVQYDHIISKAIIGKDEDWKKYLNYDSVHFHEMSGEPALKKVRKGDIIQLQRKGFYICDNAYSEKSVFSDSQLPIVLIAIPDGSKPQTATTTKGGSSVKKSVETTSTSAANDLECEIVKQGDLVRQLKAADPKSVESKAAIAKLLELKKKFKEVTGAEYKPKPATTTGGGKEKKKPASTDKQSQSTSSKAIPGNESPDELCKQIEEQGNLVRSLKSANPKSDDTKAAIAKLLQLKATYKTVTGNEYKPKPVKEASSTVGSAETASANELQKQIEEQGNLVRSLKAANPKGDEAKAAIAKLLELKAQYKSVTGNEYKPKPVQKTPLVESGRSEESPDELRKQIEEQGNLVRSLKGANPKSDETKAAIAKLLELKASFKSLTGNEYKPNQAAAVRPTAVKQEANETKQTETAQSGSSTQADSIAQQIQQQGDLVRTLKAKDPKSQESKDAIAKLLELKKTFKDISGNDYTSSSQQPNQSAKKNGKSNEKANEKAKKSMDLAKESDGRKRKVSSSETSKQTKLRIETSKEDNYSEWYSQVITKADMIEYYDVSGCYVLRPWAFSIWEVIKKWLDKEIKKLGVRNCYFPMFVSQSALEKEKTHISDFAPEVAWVTRAGSSEMAEPIAIRPTSETVMYPSYAKWIKSHRDLPLRLNQWCNVVRWEFKHPTPFLRTREFLWQEGHTAFQTAEEAQQEVYQILDLYAKVYTDLMAIPVVKGRKSEKEKFAGGEFTTTVEAYVPVNGRAIQGATSHHLGQNFSKMFDISFEDPENGSKAYAYQNSWGITTRTIGAMVMIHGDNSGLVLPPRIAPVQVVVVPVGITAQTSDEQRKDLLQKAKDITEILLKEANIRAESDLRDNYSPGWKFNYWEQKGVPIRMEIGPKDVAKSQVTCVIRHSGVKLALPMDDISTKSNELLDQIHKDMFEKAREARESHRKMTFDWNEFKVLLDKKFVLISPFCGGIDCEDAIKKETTREESADPGAPAMGAKTLCIPLEQPEVPLPDKCIRPDCNEKAKYFTLFGRSY